MTPKESDHSRAEMTFMTRGHSPLVNVSRNHENATNADTTSIAIKDMEAKILEKVSMLTISTNDQEEEEAATEVSFTADDIAGLTETTIVAPASHGGMTLSSSPLVSRSKRMASSLATPIHSSDTPQVSNFGPRRKKRRGPGTLADAPRLPFDNEEHEAEPNDVSPFLVYDQRLDRLVSRLTTADNEVPPPDALPLTTPLSSPIQCESSSSQASSNGRNGILLPPVVSWIKPRPSRRRRRHSRGGRRHGAQQQRTCPSVPCLSPRPQQRELTPLESLALEINASPIVTTPMPVLH
jgi:hypothetical protein